MVNQYNGDIENVKALINATAQINDSIDKLIELTKAEKLLPLVYRNQIISTNDLQEQNDQLVNDVYLNSILKGLPITSSQYNSLLAVSDMCPFIGGTAVYRARAIIFSINDSISWNDDSICVANGIAPRLASNQNKEVPDFMVYPNPAVGFVSFEVNSENSGEIRIYDIYGREIHNLAVPVGIQKIHVDLLNIESMVVFYSYRNGVIEKHGKVSLIK